MARGLADDSPFKQGLHHVADGFTTRRWIDLYKGQEVGVIVNSRFTRRATETLEDSRQGIHRAACR